MEISDPARPRALAELSPELGPGAVEISMHSATAGRKMCLAFRNEEEVVLFLYFLSIAATKHNVEVNSATLPFMKLSNAMHRNMYL